MPSITCNGRKIELVPERTPIAIPNKCPICSGPVKMDGANLRCTNKKCEGIGQRLIRRWIKSLDIKYIGESTEQKLWSSGLVRDPADLYILNLSDLATCCSGEKLARKIIGQIDVKRNLTIPELFGSLGIQFLGKRSAEIIMQQKNGPKTLKDWLDPASFVVEIPGLGETMCEAIATGIRANTKLINKLLRHGVTIKTTEPTKTGEKTMNNGNLAGMSFCFTGAIQKESNGKRMTRSDMHDLVVENGGVVAKVVSGSLTYLVMADPDSNSSKAQKARKLGVTILSEDDFFEMIGK